MPNHTLPSIQGANDVAKRLPEGSVALGWGRGSFGGASGFRLPMDPRPKTEVMTDLLYV